MGGLPPRVAEPAEQEDDEKDDENPSPDWHFDPLVDASCRLSNTLGARGPNARLGVGDCRGRPPGGGYVP